MSVLISLLLSSVQRKLVREIPDERYNPYGGYFGRVIPDAASTRRELMELDTNVGVAAPIVAPGAYATPLSEKRNLIVDNRTVQMVAARRIGESDMEWLTNLGDNPSAGARQAVLNWAREKQVKNGESLRITRGYLLASMVVGEISWDYLGIQLATSTFRMPASLKLTPATYWRSAADVPDAAATPVTDIEALDYQATLLGGMPFNVIGMSRAAFRAMTATDEYKAQALSRAVFAAESSLPVFGTERHVRLVSDVLGKEVRILDHTFNRQNVGDSDSTAVRYTPERLAVLWHLEDENSAASWKFANVPLLKNMVAAAMGNNAFSGEVAPGPQAWAAGDDKEFTWAAQYQAQDGIGTRISRTVSATIETRNPV